MNAFSARGFSRVRLAIGAALDVLLLLMLPRLAMWSSEERAVGMAMVYAVPGAVAIICVAPVLRRGTDVQRVGSVVVMVLSALAFWPAVDYWLRMGKCPDRRKSHPWLGIAQPRPYPRDINLHVIRHRRQCRYTPTSHLPIPVRQALA